MKLSFHGAAGEVTGSAFLVETPQARVLVDFGLHQGGAAAERTNRRIPPIDFARLDAVVLTHAHLDHSGRLPLLTRAGYPLPNGKDAGRIFTTPASIELAGILLKDSASIMSMDAARYTRTRTSCGRAPVAPLYTEEDVVVALRRLSPLGYDQPREIADGITIRFTDAGHILGSASVEMTVQEEGRKTVIAFSGDIGPRAVPLLRDPVPIEKADILVLESTYGDRDHRPRAATIEEFANVLRDAKSGGGKVLIPAFAVGRTQELIYHLRDLVERGDIRGCQVYIDSPMAVATTSLFATHRELLDDDARRMIQSGHDPLAFPGLHFVHTSAESRTLNQMNGGVVVIAGSGMCTGGRILHHLRHGLANPSTNVVFVGYQGEGTLGRRLVDHAREVRIMGEQVPVKAAIHTLGGFSAHAGQSGLLNWAETMKASKPRTFLVHGEDGPRSVLKSAIENRLGYRVNLPRMGELFHL